MSAAATVTAPGREPRDAVLAWWRAMASGDLDALAQAALDDYLSAGGPDGRTIGRDAFLEGAAAFLAEAKVDDWRVADLEVRRHGQVAVCSYRWSERGSHGGRRFALGGVATDVLVLRGAGWRYQAHHVSMAPEGMG